MVAIKSEHSKIVGEVHQPIVILVNVPILQSGTVLFGAIVLYSRDTIIGALRQAGNSKRQ